jgi:hypothetical protein
MKTHAYVAILPVKRGGFETEKAKGGSIAGNDGDGGDRNIVACRQGGSHDTVGVGEYGNRK